MFPSAYSCEYALFLTPATVTQVIEPSVLSLCGTGGTPQDKRGSNASLPHTTEALRVRIYTAVKWPKAEQDFSLMELLFQL